MLNQPTKLPSLPARLVGAVVCAAAVLAACGGGGGDAGVAGTPGSTATSFAAGPITGFGSVIVNGVRFDDSSARVSDDDDSSRSKDDLKLGMITEVRGGGITSDDSGSHSRATEIRFGSEIVGPVSAIDAAARTLVVLGQTVLASDSTFFDDRLAGGFAGITVGSVLEVHAMRDAATGRFKATRIEPKPNAPFFKLNGAIGNLNATSKTFTIGAESISFAGLAVVPADLANGQVVRVKLQTTKVAGAWVASKLRNGASKVEDHDEAEVQGLITAFTSTSEFSVNGIPVNASNASFPKGTTGIVLGARVEVKGSTRDGVITATRVSIEDDSQNHRGEFELHGAISAFNSSAKTFALRGVTVRFGGSSIEFRKGTLAGLKDGAKVEVKGTRSADGTTLDATRISFED
jgi:hypothetical protein